MIQMANIQSFLDKIREARYGKDVRSSIVSALEAVNKDANYTVEVAGNMERLLPGVESATASAITAATNANEAAKAIFDEKYILTARTEFTKSTSVSPTAKGNAILEKLKGDSWQRTLTGKNLLGGLAFANLVKEKFTPAVSSVTINTTNKTFQLPGDSGFDGVEVFTNFKENTQYTFFLRGYNTLSGYTTLTNLEIAYTDGTHAAIHFASESNTTNIVISNANKTISSLRGDFAGGTAYFSYEDFGIFEGVCSLEDFEPFCGATPSPNPSYSQTIHSVGDMGWFDGEWTKAFLNTSTGAVTTTQDAVVSKNAIPCQEGDIIGIEYTDGNLTLNTGNKEIRVCFYNSDNMFVHSVAINKGGTTTAPSGATKFKFDLAFTTYPFELSDIGHVCVTINGKYALIVDKGNKNLYKSDEAKNGYYLATSTKFTSTGTEAVWQVIVVEVKPNSDLTLSGFDNAYGAYSAYLNSDNVNDVKQIAWSTHLTNGTHAIPDGVHYVGICYSNGSSTNRQIEVGSVVTEYEAHKKERHYIPLDEPLRGINGVADEVKCVDGVYGQYRDRVITKIKSTGGYNATHNWYYITFNAMGIANIDYKKPLLCTHFRYSSNWSDVTNVGNIISTQDGVFIMRVNGFTTLEEYKTFFSENDVYVEYGLTEPTFTPFEDQSPFYNLMAYDEVTHVSIAGCHEELNPIATMRFPRNEDGALVTTNWCENRKNEIAMNELKVALMELGRL